MGKYFVMELDYDGKFHRYPKCSKCERASHYHCDRCNKPLCEKHKKHFKGEHFCKECWDK